MLTSAVELERPISKKDWGIHLISPFLWSSIIPDWMNMILKIYSELQIIATLGFYTFDNFASDNPSATEQFIRNIFKYASLSFTYNFTSDDGFTIAATIVSMIYTLAIFCLTSYLIVVYILKLKNTKLILTKVLIALGIIHHTLFFQGIQYFTFSFLKARMDSNTSTLTEFYSLNSIYALLIVVVIMNIIFGAFTSRFTYYPIQNGKSLANRSSSSDFLSLIFKFIQITLTIMSTNHHAKIWLCTIHAFIFISYRLFKYMNEMTFYNYNTFCLFLLFGVIAQSQAVLNLLWTIVIQKRHVISYFVLYTQIIFAIVFNRICLSWVDKVIWTFALKPNKYIKTNQDFFIKLFSLNKLLIPALINKRGLSTQQAQRDELLLVQLISYHAESCIKESCICKLMILDKAIEFGTLANVTKVPDKERLYFELLRDFYYQAIPNIKESGLVKLNLANLLMENDEKTCLGAVQLIEEAKLKGSRLETRIIAHKALHKLEEKMQSAFYSDDIGLKIKEVIQYKLAKSKFVNHIIANTKLFLKFWEIYNVPKPIIRKLLIMNRRINIDAEQINKLWEELTCNFSQLCYKDYITYAAYLRLLRNAPFTSDKIFRTYSSLVEYRLNARNNSSIGQDIFFAEDKIIVSVSLNAEKFGTISYISQSIEILGYTTREVCGKDFSMLMSPFFAKRCHSFVREQLQTGLQDIMDRTLPVVVQSSKGDVISAKLNIVPYPHLDQGFYCLGIIELMKSNHDHLFVLPDGRIESYSGDLADKLNLNLNNRAYCFLNDVCEDHAKLTQYISHKEAHLLSASKLRDKPNHSRMAHSTLITVDFDSSKLLSPKTKLLATDIHTSPSSSFRDAPTRNKQVFKFHREELEAAENNQESFEDFSQGVKLRFKPYKLTNFTKVKDAIFYNTSISIINYKEDNIYILKLQEIDEENENSGNTTVISMHKVEINKPKSALLQKNKSESPGMELEVYKESGRDQKMRKNIISSPSMHSPRQESPEVNNKTNGNTVKRKTHMEDAVQTRDKMTKFINSQRKKALNKLNQVVDENSQTSSTNEGLRALAKFESAIYYKNNKVYYKLVKVSVAALVLLSIVLFIYYKVQGDEDFFKVTNNVNVLKTTIERLFMVTESSRRIANIIVLQNGYQDKNRNWAADYGAQLVINYLPDLQKLSQLNNDLQNMIYNFTTEQQKVFFEPIEVNQVDQISTIIPRESAFEICTQIITAGMRLYADRPKAPAVTNPNLRFIFNNTLNGLVIHTEKLYDLLMKKDKEIIQDMKNLIIYLIYISIGLGMIVIGVLIQGEIAF